MKRIITNLTDGFYFKKFDGENISPEEAIAYFDVGMSRDKTWQYRFCKQSIWIIYGLRAENSGKKSRRADVYYSVTAVPGNGGGTYLPTAKAKANKGYSASIFDCNVDAKGGAILVEKTLEELNKVFAE